MPIVRRQIIVNEWFDSEPGEEDMTETTEDSDDESDDDRTIDLEEESELDDESLDEISPNEVADLIADLREAGRNYRTQRS
jgi:hypothetical protein